MDKELTIIGGGLAGSEAAWQAATMGIKVNLYEMRPSVSTGAHKTSYLSELVCSNSLGSTLVDRASGLLKEELRRLGSVVLRCAEETAVPAGGALAVDREAFAAKVTEKIESHPKITIIREEAIKIPESPVIVASGPLTSSALAENIRDLTSTDALYFFDAIAPIVTRDSIDMSIAFQASRFESLGMEGGDYINCPMNNAEYERFVSELQKAERIKLHEFELEINQGVIAGSHKYFESCLPVEIIARRGERSLAFGPLRPIGLRDPRSGRRPVAVVQLRQDNLAGSLYNLVGFQTNLTFPEQRRVFRLIPGLEKAEFVRYGQMHRNTYIASPLLLNPTLQFKTREDLFFAGQITGVEGYMGNIATGWLAGQNAARLLLGKPTLELPVTTMLGGLCFYVTHAALSDFQPMKANFGILPELENSINGKRARAALHAQRALKDLDSFISDHLGS